MAVPHLSSSGFGSLWQAAKKSTATSTALSIEICHPWNLPALLEEIFYQTPFLRFLGIYSRLSWTPLPPVVELASLRSLEMLECVRLDLSPARPSCTLHGTVASLRYMHYKFRSSQPLRGSIYRPEERKATWRLSTSANPRSRFPRFPWFCDQKLNRTWLPPTRSYSNFDHKTKETWQTCLGNLLMYEEKRNETFLHPWHLREAATRM